MDNPIIIAIDLATTEVLCFVWLPWLPSQGDSLPPRGQWDDLVMPRGKKSYKNRFMPSEEKTGGGILQQPIKSMKEKVWGS